MKKTTNYNLLQPEGHEYVQVEDLNENAAITDTELKKREDEIKQLAGEGRTTETVEGISTSLKTHKEDGNVHVTKAKQEEWDEKETPSGSQEKIDAAIASLINGSPGALDTLNELAKALGDDPNFATTIINRLAGAEQDLKVHKENDIQHGKIGTKEVDETDLQDNYTLRYDAIEGKWVMVESKIDRTPPSPVTDVVAKADNQSVSINYTPPSDDDYTGTRLVYKTGGYPTGINDGTIIGNYISGTTVAGLTNDLPYYFRLFAYDSSNNYNEDTNQQVTATPTEQRIYGVRIDKSNSNPDTRVAYIGDATGFTPMSGNNGSFSWGSWEQPFSDLEIKPVVLNNRVVQYYLNPNNFNQKEDGSAADLTGADGDVMTEFGKPLWYKWTDEGTTFTVEVSDKIFDGAVKHAFEVEEGYNLTPYHPLLLTQILFVLLFKSTNSQTALGRGRVDGTGYISTGNTDADGMFYGSESDEQMKFLGMEDYWGNKLWWIDGLVTDDNYNLLIGKDNFNDGGTGYEVHDSGVSASVSGYIDTVQGGNDKGFIIGSANGSESTYYADYGYLSSSRVAFFGGYRSVGSNAGFAYLRLIDSSSDANAFVGARLFCSANNKIYIGAYLGKTVGGKLRSVSGQIPSDDKTIGAFRNEARANN